MATNGTARLSPASARNGQLSSDRPSDRLPGRVHDEGEEPRGILKPGSPLLAHEFEPGGEDDCGHYGQRSLATQDGGGEHHSGGEGLRSTERDQPGHHEAGLAESR